MNAVDGALLHGRPVVAPPLLLGGFEQPGLSRRSALILGLGLGGGGFFFFFFFLTPWAEVFCPWAGCSAGSGALSTLAALAALGGGSLSALFALLPALALLARGPVARLLIALGGWACGRRRAGRWRPSGGSGSPP